MREVNLLDSYPRVKRPIEKIARSTEENRAISRQFGFEYFDGDRTYGYGGYYYDGRWKAVARRMRDYYKLTDGDAVLDVGCAKGFLLHDLKELIPGLQVAGVDIAEYAIANVIEDMKPFCKVANATILPFPDKSFDLIISINTVHNLKRDGCKQAIQEMERVGRKYKYLQVDSWFNEKQQENLMNWYLTGFTFMSVADWPEFFTECGYTGDYYWTITE
jgi:SAM-dependent methyltransferase